MSGNHPFNRRQKGLAFLALLGPVVFAIASTAAGVARTDFSYVADPNSRLGEVGSVYAPVWNVAVMFLGFSVLGLGLALYWRLGKSSRVGVVVLALSCVGFVGVGVFACDPGCPVSGSFSNNMHRIVGLIQTAYLVGIAIISRSLRKNVQWKRFYPYSVATVGVLMIIGTLSFGFTPLNLSQWTGVLAWSLSTVGLLWQEVVSIQLFRRPIPWAVA